MTFRPVFEGLIVDELDRPVKVAYIGSDPCYVVDDAGFKRHIPTVDVDRQVIGFLRKQIEGNEDLLAEQAVKMIGQDDLFSKAIIQNMIKNLDQQFENLLQTGIPEESRAYLGMMGFKAVINLHGEIIRIDQPGQIDSDDK
jgi:hypothetical protein